MQQNTQFLKNLFLRAMFPGIVTILSVNINVIVDGILVGRKIGSDALAAINLSQPLFLFMCVIGSFFAAGTTISAAHELGQNHTEKAEEYFSTCAIALLIMSAAVTGIGLLLHNPIVDFLCSDVSMRHYVMEYYLVTVCGALPTIMIYVPLWFLRLDGENTAVMLMMGVMSIGDILLDILLVYVWNLGVFGAGLASVIANAASMTLGIIWLYRKKSVFRFHLHFVSGGEAWKKLAVAGVPSALNNLASTIRLLIINTFLLRLGGSSLVAVFSVVNGVYGFGEGIVLGIPQAASPLLGVFYGEKDNDSCAIILKLEFFYGTILSAVFLALITLGSRFIQSVYKIDTPLLIPMIWMGLSVLFAAACSVLQGYYNISRHTMWSNMQILMRMIIGTLAGLLLVEFMHFSTFSFLLTAEAGTLAVWFLAAIAAHLKNPGQSKFFFMDRAPEEHGQVLNFSVENNDEQICEASEQISKFCAGNRLSPINTMTLKLSIEEMLTCISLINKKNGNQKTIHFDLRAFSLDGLQGIRVRYDGLHINPFVEENYQEDQFMGVRMITELARSYEYFKIIGSNVVTLTLEVEHDSDQRLS